jgi:hypothetical protein
MMDEWMRRARVGLGCTVMGAAAWAAIHWRTPSRKAESVSPFVRGAVAERDTSRESKVSESIGRFLERLPFDDPAVGVETVLAQPEPAAPPIAPSPLEALIIRGVVLGIVGEAIIEGLPGDARSRTLRTGERFGGVLLVQVSKEGAVVQMEQERRKLRLADGAR